MPILDPAFRRAHSFHLISFLLLKSRCYVKKLPSGFPGGAVVKSPPADAGDTGSIPVPGRSHMLRSNLAHEPQLLRPHATTIEAHVPRACAP